MFQVFGSSLLFFCFFFGFTMVLSCFLKKSLVLQWFSLVFFGFIMVFLVSIRAYMVFLVFNGSPLLFDWFSIGFVMGSQEARPRIPVSGLRAQDSELRILTSGLRIQDSGLRITRSRT